MIAKIDKMMLNERLPYVYLDEKEPNCYHLCQRGLTLFKTGNPFLGVAHSISKHF